MKKILSFILFLFLATSVFAAETYYVETNGDDDNCTGLTDADYDGSGSGEDCAFKTIQKAVDATYDGSSRTSGADDNVIVGDGKYSDRWFLNNHGGSAESSKNISLIGNTNPIMVVVPSHGYSNGDKILIDDLDITTGMDHATKRLYTISNVTTDTFTLDDEDGTTYRKYKSGGTATKIHPLTIKAKNSRQAIIDTRVIITGWDNTGLEPNVYKSLSGYTQVNGALWEDDNDNRLTNVTSLDQLDQAGEKYFDNTTDTFYVYNQGDPNDTTYTSTNNASSFSINSVDYVVVEGFVTGYTPNSASIGTASPASDGPGTNYIFIRDSEFKYCSSLSCITNQTASNRPSSHIYIDQVTVRDNFFSSDNGHGIKFAANDNADNGSFGAVTRSTIYNVQFHGVQFSNAWRKGTFYGNRIYNVAQQGDGQGAGIRCGTTTPGEVGETIDQGCDIYDNNIGNGAGGVGQSQATGIFLQENIHNVRVYGNYIHDNNWHAVYIFSTSVSADSELYGRDIYVFNNIFANNKQNGIRIEESASVYILNNTIDESAAFNSGGGAGISTQAAWSQGIVALNNIITSVDRRAFLIATGSSIYSDHNDLFRSDGLEPIKFGSNNYTVSAYSQLTGNDTHSLSLNPLYNDKVGRDYSLNSLSPTLQGGKNMNELFEDDYNNDQRGNIWDMGAYENSAETVLEGVTIN